MASQDQILPAVNRIDALFREPDLENYYLSVQVGERSFSYCILDSRSNKFIGVGEMRQPVARGRGEQEVILPFESFMGQVFASLPVLRKKFKSSKVVWEGNKYTFIPEHLYEEKENKSVLAFNIPLDGRDQVSHDRLAGFRIVNLFAIPQKAREILARSFGVDHIPHVLSVLVESINLNYRGQLIRPKVFLHIREHSFDLVVMDQAKLHYANTFEFHQPEDLVYYTIFAMEQLGFNQDQAEVVLMGRVTRNTPLFNMIFKYLRRVEFAKRQTVNEYSFIFNEIPPHAYYALLNLNQCGL